MFLRTKLIIGLLAASELVTSTFAAPMKSAEDAREISTSSVTLPASDAGVLYFKNCDVCNKNPLQLSVSTKLMIDTQVVSFNAFKAAFESTSNQLATVFYKPDTHLITRITLTPSGHVTVSR